MFYPTTLPLLHDRPARDFRNGYRDFRNRITGEQERYFRDFRNTLAGLQERGIAHDSRRLHDSLAIIGGLTSYRFFKSVRRATAPVLMRFFRDNETNSLMSKRRRFAAYAHDLSTD